MDERERQIRIRLRDDFLHYSKKCLKIRTKKGDVKPFELNKSQLYIHETVERQKLETQKVRIIGVKGRQVGFSTYIEGRFYWRVTHGFGIRAFILTHDTEATNNLFDMAKRYHDNCPILVKPTVQASNAKELIFSGLDSGYKLGTAGNKAVGRSSTIQLLHSSEVAYQPHSAEHAKGILQAVSNEAGTEIFFESTANGVGNYFHEQWQMAEAGLSDFIPVFIPWYWQDEYTKPIPNNLVLTEKEEELMDLYPLTLENLIWRRGKIAELSVGGMDGEKAMMQEYPLTPTEAFQTSGEDVFIPPWLVMPARKGECEPFGPLLIGVDPARFGDDRTAIIRRQTRKSYGLEKYVKKDTMEIVGIVHLIIERENPAKVFVDVGGLGAGIYDRLKELHRNDNIVVPVNSADTPLDAKKYANKRAEMWGQCKEWLRQNPVQIPDSDELHADLCGPRYKPDSNGRLLIESKEKMKKRGIRSSDCADALCLTFAFPESVYNDNNTERNRKVAKTITNTFSKVQELRKKRYDGDH